MTPAQFRTAHGDSTAWSSAEFETYEHLVERADPGIARAARDGLVVIGRHADAGRVVVDLATAALPSTASTSKTLLAG